MMDVTGVRSMNKGWGWGRGRGRGAWPRCHFWDGDRREHGQGAGPIAGWGVGGVGRRGREWGGN